MTHVQRSLQDLEAILPHIRLQADSDGLMRDLIEAIEYWGFLARSAIANNTRINYPERAAGQLLWLAKLKDAFEQRGADQQYEQLLTRCSALLLSLREIHMDSGGHLGVLTVIRKHFQFLFACGYSVVAEEPSGIRFASQAVYVQVAYASKSYLSFQLGLEPKRDEFFGIEDLLYMYGDSRYRAVPQDLVFDNTEQIEQWFKFLADTLREYGTPLLNNEPDAFQRLKAAQMKRDAEYVSTIRPNTAPDTNITDT